MIPRLKQFDGVLDNAKQQLGGVVIVVGVLWAFYITDWLPLINWPEWLAMRPRQLIGLHGIVTMPFVHSGLAHLIANTIPLIIMLLILVFTRPRIWFQVLVMITLTSGVLTWIFGGAGKIVGASGVVLGLVTFLIAPGGLLLFWWGYCRLMKVSKPAPFRFQPIPLVISALVGFFYLDNLVFGLIPVFPGVGNMDISWRAHWCGAIAGVLVAMYVAKTEDDLKGSVSPTSVFAGTSP